MNDLVCFRRLESDYLRSQRIDESSLKLDLQKETEFYNQKFCTVYICFDSSRPSNRRLESSLKKSEKIICIVIVYIVYTNLNKLEHWAPGGQKEFLK